MSNNLSDIQLLMSPLNTKIELQNWCEYFLGFTLPDCKVSRFSDSTPLDWTWEVYRAVMDGKPLHTIAIAGRDSSKTVSLSVIDLLCLLHDQRSAVHLAMLKDQAKRAREYLENYINKIPLLRDAVIKQNTTELKLNIGGETVGLELIPLSIKAVQGSHAALVTYDEIGSSVDPTNRKAYRDSAGIPGSDKKSGKPAVIAKISSRHTGNTIVEQEIKNSPQSGVQIRKWSTLDTMRKCPDSRSGTEDLPLWINIKKGLKYTDDEFAKISLTEKEGFERTTDTKKNCYSCPLAVYCQGSARKQTSTSTLLREIDDVITKVNAASSHDWVMSQICSAQPASEGLVYHEFDPDIHIPSWQRLWQILTGVETTAEITRDLFIKELKRKGAQFYAGIDWGFVNPSTCIVIAVYNEKVFLVDSIYEIRKNEHEFAHIVKEAVHAKYDIQMYCPDSESQSGIDLLKERDLPVAKIDKGSGSVKSGISCVRKLLRIPGTNREARFFILPDLTESPLPNVPGIVEEFGLYAKDVDISGKPIDDRNPVKANDHGLDGLRYVIYWLFGKTLAQAVFATPYEPAAETNNLYGPDLIRSQGLYVNDNRDQFDDQGRPKKKPGDDDPDGGGNSGGGGLQIFWT